MTYRLTMTPPFHDVSTSLNVDRSNHSVVYWSSRYRRLTWLCFVFIYFVLCVYRCRYDHGEARHELPGYRQCTQAEPSQSRDRRLPCIRWVRLSLARGPSRRRRPEGRRHRKFPVVAKSWLWRHNHLLRSRCFEMAQGRNTIMRWARRHLAQLFIYSCSWSPSNGLPVFRLQSQSSI